ncbi:hypothetical protein KZC51_04005 [Microbacterium sp. SSW1-49]|uniref:Uncharacterized protein n=1 Tax=Microbacterium croceum TaxID=2851645 RepID=A0ABT0FB55_9MICO|nr:hypothetical protein [Microbacterium croceum]MCK2035292.1 hypothetical protein [Microbacterium croceum]
MLGGAGCSAIRSEGPLEIGADSGAYCAPGDVGREVGFGDAGVLTGDAPATIASVDLVDADGLRLTEAYVAPLRQGQVGFGTFFPEDEDSEGWSNREDPAGYEVEPGEMVSVIVIAARTGAEGGTASMIRVIYEVQGVRYEAFTSTELTITDSCL